MNKKLRKALEEALIYEGICIHFWENFMIWAAPAVNIAINHWSRKVRNARETYSDRLGSQSHDTTQSDRTFTNFHTSYYNLR